MRLFVNDNELVTLVRANKFRRLIWFQLSNQIRIVRILHRVDFQLAIVLVGDSQIQLLFLIVFGTHVLFSGFGRWQGTAIWYLDVSRVQSHFLAEDCFAFKVSDDPDALLLATIPPLHHASIDGAYLFLLIYEFVACINDYCL